MRFLLSPVLILLCLLPLAGCLHRGGPRKPLLDIIVPPEDNPFFMAEANAAAARGRELGFRVRVNSHGNDAYRQDQLIDMAIASNASALILDNAGSISSVASVRRATRAGIACVLIDRPITADGIAKAQIISDNLGGAKLVAAYFASQLDYTGNYAELLGTESDDNAQIRTTGFHDVLDQYKGLKRVSAESANWSQSEAFNKTEVILESHPHLKGIIAGNDTMALGAVAAVRDAGRHMVIVGFDGSPDALAAIRAGALQATVMQPAVKIAQLGVEEAARYLRTGSTGHPERQVIPCELVTRANVGDFRNFERIHGASNE